MGANEKRFYDQIVRIPFSGCWVWNGWVKPNGYGGLSKDGKTAYAHRVSWELHKGPIPDGLCVCHHCDVRCCVNPDHLFLGDQKANIADMYAKNRQNIASKHGADNPMFGRQHQPFTRLLQSRAKQGMYTGALHPRAQINEKLASMVKAMRTNGLPIKAIAADLGISHHVVGNIVHNKSWSHVPWP